MNQSLHRVSIFLMYFYIRLMSHVYDELGGEVMEKDLIIKLIYAGFSNAQLHRFYKQFGSFKYINRKYMHMLGSSDLKLNMKLERLKSINTDHVYRDLERTSIKLIFSYDSSYPKLLKEIYDYPFVLFCKGDCSLLNQNRSLAIVGGRERTNYTQDVLKTFIPRFIEEEIVIVSGLAKGTDCDAHVITLLNYGKSIGVLGFGHDHHYPKETASVRSMLEKLGLVISEYPPFVGPQKWHFPERNRIISGLTNGTFVTEAKEKSGSLITIDQAIDQNRNVYCLPGPIQSDYSKGCNLRIQEGAKMVLQPSDIIEDFL